MIYQEELESEPEFEEEEQELESEQTKTKHEIKATPKRKNTNIYDFINKKCRER